jgi:hypothetical protein
MKAANLVFLFFLLIAGTGMISAASNGPTRKPVVKAFRATQPVSLDGKLLESEWKDVNAVSDFLQLDPKEGATASEKTIVDILYDDDALYIGARMYDSSPKDIVARLGRKDVTLTSDRFVVYLDPYHDHRSGYYFGLNAAGTKYDGTLLNDTWNDDSWDGVWEGKTNIDEKGWTAEFRIPYSQLRFQKKDQYIWGINFKREIARKNENDFLVYQPKNENGFVSRFPDLTGVEHISPRRRLEIIPYLTSKAEFTNQEARNPFNDGSLYNPGVGADAKIGLGTNLTLDATVNPDFGQVEVDPAVVNLSDVETFFPEKRPFFVEGSSIFAFGEGGASNYWGFNWASPQMFYSRRIGRAPQGSLPDADFERVPDGTSILGATKLTGKIGNGWNIGTLHAFTGREHADLQIAGQNLQSEVEPLTYYGVYRGQKEFGDGRSALGFMTTLSHRFFDDPQLRDVLSSRSSFYGVDGWRFLDSDQEWVLTGWAGLSNVAGTAARITDLQENSQHYFQRPDAGYVSVDPNATSLTGYAGRIYLNKQKGNVFVNSAFGLISPGFDVNDLGFLWRADVVNFHAGGGYKWTQPGKYFQFNEIGGAVFRNLDYDLNTTWSGVYVFGYMQFHNYYTIDWSTAWNPETTFNNTRTRGGPQTLNLPGYEFNLSVNSDSRKRWVFGVGGNLYESDSSRYRAANFSVEFKPSSNISVSMSPSYEYDFAPAAWIDSFTDPLATATFGSRYLFGQLNQKTLSASMRLNWTFSPNLSLQLFGQPLISSGNYSQFKQLARPKSYAFDIFDPAFTTVSGDDISIDPDGSGPSLPLTFSNPDFNFKSLRGNAILRWEYRPGTTVYFVWTQSRSQSETIGDLQLGRSLARLWSEKADNIFLVKFSYYWNP